MIGIVNVENRKLYEREVDEMFKLRFRVAIEHWRWRLPDAGGGRDIDQFDTQDTTYFLAMRNGVVRGCARLNPTTSPHLLSEIFNDCCDLQGVKRAEAIYEFSRYVIDPTLRRRDYKQVMGELEYAINRYCLAVGIKELTWLSYEAVYQHALSVWETRPLGLPKHFEDDDATYIAGVSRMTAGGLDRIRQKYKFDAGEPLLQQKHDWSEVNELFASERVTDKSRRAA